MTEGNDPVSNDGPSRGPQESSGDPLILELEAICSMPTPSSREIILDSFCGLIPEGRLVETSYAMLAKSTKAMQQANRVAVTSIQEVVADFKETVTAIDRFVFTARQKAHSDQYYTGPDTYRAIELTGLASSDDEKIAALVEVKNTASGNSCLPPWQLFYEGAIEHLGERISGARNDPNAPKRIEVTNAVWFEKPPRPGPESFSDKVAMALVPGAEREHGAAAPINGDRLFLATPIFSQEAWAEALGNVVTDLGEFTCESLVDIARIPTSFMLGWMMVEAQRQIHEKFGKGDLSLSKDLESRKSCGDFIRFKNAVIQSPGEDNIKVDLYLHLDPKLNTPVLEMNFYREEF